MLGKDAGRIEYLRWSPISGDLRSKLVLGKDAGTIEYLRRSPISEDLRSKRVLGLPKPASSGGVLRNAGTIKFSGIKIEVYIFFVLVTRRIESV